MTEPFNVKSEILKEIGKTSDPSMKTILLLMLGVLEEISDKIDTVISDEKSLRDTVLNGHSDQHHAHHDWIANRIKHNGMCEWANTCSARDKEAKADKKSLVTKFFEGLIQQSATVIITALAVAAGFTFLK